MLGTAHPTLLLLETKHANDLKIIIDLNVTIDIDKFRSISLQWMRSNAQAHPQGWSNQSQSSSKINTIEYHHRWLNLKPKLSLRIGLSVGICPPYESTTRIVGFHSSTQPTVRTLTISPENNRSLFQQALLTNVRVKVEKQALIVFLLPFLREWSGIK